MIVVEGPDGGGKSTLIQQLQKNWRFEVEPRPCTSDQGIDMTTLREWVDRELDRPLESPTVYDRHPLISEPIYGPLVRGRMADGFEDVEWMANALGAFYSGNPLIVYCLPPLATVKHNIQATHAMTTPHMRAVNVQARAIWNAYCHRAAVDRAAGVRMQVWDYTHPKRDQILLDLIVAWGEFL